VYIRGETIEGFDGMPMGREKREERREKREEERVSYCSVLPFSLFSLSFLFSFSLTGHTLSLPYIHHPRLTLTTFHTIPFTLYLSPSISLYLFLFLSDSVKAHP
jgi:hypothetical protein